MNVLGLAIAVGIGFHHIWLISVFLCFLYYIINMHRFLKFSMSLGYANWVTIFRLSIIFALAFSYSYLENSTLAIFFTIAIILDGVDGYLARKFNQCSKAGECLDMESDAFLVILISWIHYDFGTLPSWILIPGGLRYYFGLSFFWLRQAQKEFPPKRIRATIAVLFFIALVVPFVISSQLSSIIIMISSICIILSFKASLVHRVYCHLKN